ncbi:hypothetical protein M501DRAFT_875204 [Patellaria atrata CBS 101060]|uniref:Uncharacterized protein n=1 Tax=Patellaria atrata CBS 101060 TaxID=1346257 RepID=A0A9P4VMA0_9PEZI|nr:hypothetical protein M501DRAFT_875204 [Patellaria atrata CBS 101060]
MKAEQSLSNASPFPTSFIIEVQEMRRRATDFINIAKEFQRFGSHLQSKLSIKEQHRATGAAPTSGPATFNKPSLQSEAQEAQGEAAPERVTGDAPPTAEDVDKSSGMNNGQTTQDTNSEGHGDAEVHECIKRRAAENVSLCAKKKHKPITEGQFQMHNSSSSPDDRTINHKMNTTKAQKAPPRQTQSEQLPSTHTPQADIEFEDISAEVEARLRAKEEERRIKIKTHRKRRRSSIDSAGTVGDGLEQLSVRERKRARMKGAFEGQNGRPQRSRSASVAESGSGPGDRPAPARSKRGNELDEGGECRRSKRVKA